MSDVPLVAIISAMAVTSPEQFQQIKTWLSEQRAGANPPASLVVDRCVLAMPVSDHATASIEWVDTVADDLLRKNTEDYMPDVQAIQEVLARVEGKGLLVRHALGSVANLVQLHDAMRELLYACAKPPAVIAFEVAPKDMTAMSISAEALVQVNPNRLTSYQTAVWVNTIRTRVLFSVLKTLTPGSVHLLYMSVKRVIKLLTTALSH
ncbi:hypothetical protein D3C77_190940 [compost metagenome]